MSDSTDARDNHEDLAAGYLVRLNARAWGIALGLCFGLGLFAATNILLLRGGEDMGSHLGLLSQYFPGYDVHFVGSLIGFGYAFVLGFVIGWGVCKAYNLAARRR